jgi:hypothetical protein
MNGKNVLDSFDLDDYHLFDQKIDAVSELNRDAIVVYGKDSLDLEVEPECLEFVRQTNPVGPLQQSWPQFGMHSISGAEDAVGQFPVNKMNSVPFVRFGVLRGSAFTTQRVGRS